MRMAQHQVELSLATFSTWTMVTAVTSIPYLTLSVKHHRLESSWQQDFNHPSSTDSLLKLTTLTKNNQVNCQRSALTTLVTYRQCKADPQKFQHPRLRSRLAGMSHLTTVDVPSKDILSSSTMATTETLRKLIS